MMTKKPKSPFIDDVLLHFCFPAQFVEIKAFGSGLINDTYLISYTSNSRIYILQRINHHIFTNVELLMDNISKVTLHLQQQLKLRYPADFHKRAMVAERAFDGQCFYKDQEGNYWRVFNYLENMKTYDTVTTTKQAYEGGRGFGEFQYFLSNLNPSHIHETIPNFHNIDKRLTDFWLATKADPLGRMKHLSDEVELINSKSDRMNYIPEQAKIGKLPLRVVHNDTKFNNILLNQNDIAHCVIDLDTVMPGYVAYDFGDAIRSIVNKAPEDEPDLKKIEIDLFLYQAFTNGYLSETMGFLTQNEIDSLAEGAILFPYMQAVRFLTDYINGDVYYKIDFDGHNLQRARAQLQLFLKMEEKYDDLKLIVDKIAVSLKNYKS